MKKSKTGIWLVNKDHLQQLLFLPKSVRIEDIYVPHGYDNVVSIQITGNHKSLYKLRDGAAIPHLSQELLDKLFKDKVNIRKLSDKVVFIRDLEE